MTEFDRHDIDELRARLDDLELAVSRLIDTPHSVNDEKRPVSGVRANAAR